MFSIRRKEDKREGEGSLGAHWIRKKKRKERFLTLLSMKTRGKTGFREGKGDENPKKGRVVSRRE